jgi:hypothetical protein
MKPLDISGFTPFKISDYLDNDETIYEYLLAAAADPDPEVFLRAAIDVGNRDILND